MNNDQFRKLVLDNPSSSKDSSAKKDASKPTPGSGSTFGAKPRAFGAFMPRAVAKGNVFKQASKDDNRPSKKFKASSAPLGTALPSGYIDRARLREEAEEDEKTREIRERERRLQELSERAKKGEIDMEEVIEESKRLGGDISSTHLVRGLDFKLLEKVRRGEDVLSGKKELEEKERDVDEELDEALEREVVVEKKPPPPKKKTRAEVMAELKKAREEAERKRLEEEKLNSKFRKIGEKREKKEEEDDEPKIKYITTADGKVKRVRVKKKAPKEDIKPTGPALGMEVPAAPPPPKDDSDSDIFEGVGNNYDPFDGVRDDSSSSDSDDSSSDEAKAKREKKAKSKADEGGEPSEPRKKVKLFDDDEEEQEKLPQTASDLLAANPEIAAALKKAAALAEKREVEKTVEEKSKEMKLQKMLQDADRDMDDLDMGFGGTTNFADDDEDGPVTGGSKKRKRGKKKGDKNDIESVQKYAKS